MLPFATPRCSHTYYEGVTPSCDACGPPKARLRQNVACVNADKADKKGGAAASVQVARACWRNPELLLLSQRSHHQCLIHAAAATGDAKMLRSLIACASAGDEPHAVVRALVNARNARGQTPLMLAAFQPAATECVRLLLEAGADAWVADVCGARTALFYAAAADAADNAGLLLDATADQMITEVYYPNSNDTPYVDVRMMAGFTALHMAAIVDARAVLRVLLGAGARLCCPTLFGSYDFITCPRGTSAMHLAARCGVLLLVGLGTRGCALAGWPAQAGLNT